MAGHSRSLLACGIVAGPLYVMIGIIQIMIRPGFDIKRHALSLMSNGDLGWIQIGNFIISGLLIIAFAVGIRLSFKGSPGGTFGPILFAIYAVGLIGAGIFKADPGLGFPPGTPLAAHGISTSGLMHFVFGGIGFYALIAACFVFARRFAKTGKKALMWFSIFTGVFFFVSFAGIASGSGSDDMRATVTLTFYAAIFVVWVWISVTAYSLRLDFTMD